MSLFAYLLSGEWSEKNCSDAEKFSGCLAAVAFLSLVEKNFSACVFFSHTFRHIAVAPQHLAEGWSGSMRHGFASDGAVTLGMAMGWSWECPQGTSPKGVAGDLKHSQV